MEKIRIKPLVTYGLMALLSLCYMVQYLPTMYYRNFSLFADVIYFYLARPGFIIGLVACIVILAVDLLDLTLPEKVRKLVKISALFSLAVAIVYFILIAIHLTWMRFLPLAGVEWPFNLIFVVIGIICGLYIKKENKLDAVA